MKKMKRLFAMALTLAMLLSLGAPGIQAVNNVNASDFSLVFSQTGNTLTVALNCAKDVTGFGAAAGDMSIQNGSNYFTLTAITAGVLQDMTANVGDQHWGASAKDYTNGDSMAAGTWVTYTYTVSEEIPAETYTFNMVFDDGCYDIGFSPMAYIGATISGTYTVAGSQEPETPAPTEAYTAEIKADKTELKVGEKVTVDVVVGGTTGSFASALVGLTYDSNYLSLTSTTLNGATLDDSVTGTLTIADHGQTQNNGTAYTLVFTAKDDTEATEITQTKAGFSTAENALDNLVMLDSADLNSLSVKINPADLTVTLPTGFTGNKSVAYGATYTFQAENKNYTYEINVTGGTAVETAEGSGVWTVENVTNNLVITITSQAAKQYNVTWDGTGAADIQNKAEKATYNVDFTVTLPADKAASTEAGYTYSVSAKLGETTIGAYDEATRTLTIDGEQITGDLTITVTKATVDPNQFTVTLSGQAELTANKEVVNKGESVTLTLAPVTGYKYTVTVNGTAVELTDNKYTISNITANVTVNTTREIDLDGKVTVQSYMDLGNNKTMYLVTVSTVLDSGNVYKYGEEQMFWSATYGANAYLVIADTALTADDVKGNITITTGTTKTVVYTGDVNMAAGNVIDMNDAQLVYNMYATKMYQDFDTVTVEMFLRADMNTTVGIDTTDATVIVNKVLGK